MMYAKFKNTLYTR